MDLLVHKTLMSFAIFESKIYSILIWQLSCDGVC